MNATGDSDTENYVKMAESERERLLADPLPVLDEVLARDAGIREVPDYSWPSLVDLSDLDVATAAKVRAEAVEKALTMGAIDEDEAREMLDGTPVFGPLEGPAPEPEEPEIPPGMGFGGPPNGAPPPVAE